MARPCQSVSLLGHQCFDSLQDLSSAGVAMAGRAGATAGPGGTGAARVALQEVLWFDSVPRRMQVSLAFSSGHGSTGTG